MALKHVQLYYNLFQSKLKKETISLNHLKTGRVEVLKNKGTWIVVYGVNQFADLVTNYRDSLAKSQLFQ